MKGWGAMTSGGMEGVDLGCGLRSVGVRVRADI